MPFYDLRCGDCGEEANIKASMAEKTEGRINCPECGSTNMQTVFKSAPSYVKSVKEPACLSSGVCGGGGCQHAHGMG